MLSVALAVSPFESGIAEELSLKGKTVGVTVIGTSHHWDFMAFRGQIETIERLGGRVIAYDAQHDLSGQPVPPVTFAPAVMITKNNAPEVAGPFLPN